MEKRKLLAQEYKEAQDYILNYLNAYAEQDGRKPRKKVKPYYNSRYGTYEYDDRREGKIIFSQSDARGDYSSLTDEDRISAQRERSTGRLFAMGLSAG